MKILNLSKDSIKQIKAYKNGYSNEFIYFRSDGVYIIHSYSLNHKKSGRQCIKISNQNNETNKLIKLNGNGALLKLKEALTLIDLNQAHLIELRESGLFINQNRWNCTFYYDNENTITSQDMESIYFNNKNKSLVLKLNYEQAKKFAKVESSSNDEAQIAFMGVYLDFENNKLVTTDGKRLNCFDIDFNKKYENQIIEIKPILAACKAIKKDSYIELYENDGQFIINNTPLEKIDGKFPNYQDVIPQNSEHKVKIIDNKELIKKIKIISPNSDKESKRIMIEVDKNRLYISANDVNGQAEESIEIKNITNSSGTFYLNHLAFSLALQSCDSSLLEITSSGSPIKLTSDIDESIIMPMKTDGKFSKQWTKSESIEKPIILLEYFNKQSYILDSILKSSINHNLGFIHVEKLIKESLIHKIESFDGGYFQIYCKERDKEEIFLTNKKHYKEIDNLFIKYKIKVVTMKKGTKKGTLQVLTEIKAKFNPSLERLQELINTIDQYAQEERLASLEKDLKKSEFNGLKYQDYSLLVGNIQTHDLELLYRVEENQGSSITEIKKEESADIIPAEKIDVVAEKILDKVFEISQPQFIIKFYTNKDKNKVYSPDVFKVDFSDESIIESNGYKYKIENMGKIRFHKGGKGSAYVNFALDHRPTIDEIKDLSNQFMEQLAQ